VLEWTDAREASLALDDLRSVEEAFLTSSTRDVQPIRQIVWSDGTMQPVVVGPIAEKVREIFAERAASDLDP
jgi:branched-chain amino acid aminotransferase